jgi:hypothetical protein
MTVVTAGRAKLRGPSGRGSGEHVPSGRRSEEDASGTAGAAAVPPGEGTAAGAAMVGDAVFDQDRDRV